MTNVRKILSEALDKEIISVSEWNEGIYVYVIYRIVWETKGHYILYAVHSEESAKNIVADFKSEDYFYEKVKVN